MVWLVARHNHWDMEAYHVQNYKAERQMSLTGHCLYQATGSRNLQGLALMDPTSHNGKKTYFYLLYFCTLLQLLTENKYVLQWELVNASFLSRLHNLFEMFVCAIFRFICIHQIIIKPAVTFLWHVLHKITIYTFDDRMRFEEKLPEITDTNCLTNNINNIFLQINLMFMINISIFIQPAREARCRAAAARVQRVVYGFVHLPLRWD